MRRQPISTTFDKNPNLASRMIHLVDEPARLCHLRVAPSRTSPISTIHSRNCAFTQYAVHNHPKRRDFISASQAGASHLWIYPAVTDPSMKPISDMGYGWHPDPPCLRNYITQFHYICLSLPLSSNYNWFEG